jgi:hypothetical protein
LSCESRQRVIVRALCTTPQERKRAALITCEQERKAFGKTVLRPSVIVQGPSD